MHFQPFVLLGHFAYGIAVVAFAVRDIFWLRVVAILASAVMVVHACVGLREYGRLWYIPAFWHCVFIGVHSTRLAIMIHGNRAARFNEEETELFETLFRGFTRLEFMKLLRSARWVEAAPGDVLATEGQPLPEMMLISRGAARVEAGGHEVAQLRDGQFIGEMSFTAGGHASATVTVTAPTRCLAWSKENLARMFVRDPSLRMGLNSVIAADLAAKLHRHSRAPDK